MYTVSYKEELHEKLMNWKNSLNLISLIIKYITIKLE